MDNHLLNIIVGKTIGFVCLALIILVGIGLWRIVKGAGQKSVATGKEVVAQVKNRIDGISDSGNRHDALYAKAYEELLSGNTDTASWSKAFAQSNGNSEQAKASYIKYRVEQLKEAT